jgi:large subunit ribosomal protein L13
MKTTFMASREAALAARRWYLVDASDQALGRLASRVASILRGKNNPTFTPHEDTGDFVIVVNAANIKLTGNKLKNKLYQRHTGYPGGVRTRVAGQEMREHPDRVLRQAVTGMLPKNRLGRQLATKLKIYKGEEHPHSAQQPVAVAL